MKIVLEDVSPKHYLWLKNMAEALSFKIKEVDTTKEEDEALVRAIDAGREDDVLSGEDAASFIDSLSK